MIYRKQELELVIFDLDGTLVDSDEAISMCFNLALQEMGHPERPVSEVAKLIGIPLSDMFASFVQEADVDEAVARYRYHYQTICVQKTILMPGAIELLDYMCEKQLKMAVATNKPLGFTKNILKSTQIDRYFAMTVGPDNVPKPKPDPGMIHLVINALDTNQGQTVYVGDSLTDCRTAKNAGVRMLAVATGSHTHQELANEFPHWIGNSLHELMAYLKSKEEGSA